MAAREWSIVTADGDELAVVCAGGRRQALLAYAKAVGRGMLHHSGSFRPVLLGAHDEPLRAEPRGRR